MSNLHKAGTRWDAEADVPSPRVVLLMLAALILLCWTLGGGILALLAHSQGFSLKDLLSFADADQSLFTRNFLRGVLLINHTATFLIPSVFTAWFFFRKRWRQELGLLRFPEWHLLGLGILFMMAAFPLAQFAFWGNRRLVELFPVLKPLVEAENTSEGLVEGLLVMQSPAELVFSLFVMAVLPALGEEMVFRGFLQKQLQKWPLCSWGAVLLSACFFSLVHFQVQRFLAIFWLGIILGLLLLWTKNLWIPIFAHFLNNAAQVVIAWLNQDKLSELNQGYHDNEFSFSLLMVSCFLLGWSGFQLWKSAGRNYQSNSSSHQKIV